MIGYILAFILLLVFILCVVDEDIRGYVLGFIAFVVILLVMSGCVFFMGDIINRWLA